MKRFPSVRKNQEFQMVYSKGRSFADALLVMYIYKNSLDHNRIGVSVSKKVGNSVVRHSVVRKMREIFRLSDYSSQGNDIIVVARSAAAHSDYHQLKNSYEKLCRRHGIGA